MGLMLRNRDLIKSLSSIPIPIFRQACRKITSSSSPCCSVHSSYLVKQWCGETGSIYFSALSPENWAPLRDFRSPYFKTSCCVSGICDGLVHLYSVIDDDLVWKPSTNEFKLLPPSDVGCPPHTAWNTSGCSGLGFDSKSGDYKVVRFLINFFETEEGCYNGSHQQVELYSFKSESWKEVVEEPTCWPTGGGNPVYVNGCCYWIARGKDIISFDFAQETLSCLPFPTTGKFEFPIRIVNGRFKFLGREYTTSLVEFDGSLGVIIYPWSGNEKSFELWVLNNGSWTREFEIHVVGAQDPMMISTSDGGLLFLRGSEGQLLVYDFGVQELSKLDIYDYYYKHRAMQVIPYPHTMLSLNG